MNNISRLFLLAFFLTIAFGAQAQEQSLQNVLNPDGTIRLERDGGYSLEGYELQIDENGVPRALPKGEAQTENTTSGTWGTGFSLPNGVDNIVRTLAVYNGELYVRGEFTEAGGSSANRIARWNGTSWNTLGTGSGNGVNDGVLALAVYNNSLFLGGDFTVVNVGDNPILSSRIAQWTATNAPSSYSHTVTSSISTYTFFGTGVIIEFSGVSGSGTCTVERYDNSPAQNVSGITHANVSPYRFVINASGFTFTSARLRFDRTQIPGSGITNAQTVRVYRRPTPGTGAFSLLPNDYNPSFPNEVRATTTAFSEFVLASDDNSLPVELVAFTGRKVEQGVELAWRTASEQNNAGFEVQRRSVNREVSSEQWQVLGFVRGNGTTTEAQSYSFLDRTASGKVQYRLKQVDFDGQFEYSNVIEVDAGLPKVFALEQNYPNPFNPTTVIAYQLPTASNVSLKVYDVLGKEVMTLVSGRQDAGSYNYTLNASNLSSGVYFYRLQAGTTNGASSFVQTKKMMLVK